MTSKYDIPINAQLIGALIVELSMMNRTLKFWVLSIIAERTESSLAMLEMVRNSLEIDITRLRNNPPHGYDVEFMDGILRDLNLEIHMLRTTSNQNSRWNVHYRAETVTQVLQAIISEGLQTYCDVIVFTRDPRRVTVYLRWLHHVDSVIIPQMESDLL